GQELERRLEADGSVRNLNIRLRTRAGDLLDLLLSAEAVTIGGQSCVLLVAQNVVEHRRTEVEIASAIQAAMQDTSWFSRMVLEKLAKLRRPDPPDGTKTSELSDLPPRGQDVLALVCRGMADAAIANKLGLSRNTVRNHVTALYRKTGVRTRAALVVWARERGFTGGAPPKSPSPAKD
ncbi:helix-turn-helix transcriptional regulator, partial [Muricoccus aerilatus]|uniref:helix-turn-helix transcriptional regulator n=1 Tax=Muricoccus aerilatus TaxID=452982 RepID=UPI0005C2199B